LGSLGNVTFYSLPPSLKVKSKVNSGYGPPFENSGYATAALGYVNSNILILLQMKQSLKYYPKELQFFHGSSYYILKEKKIEYTIL
jgi:hypothetical protein